MSRLSKAFRSLLMILGLAALLVALWWLYQLLREQAEEDEAIFAASLRADDGDLAVPVEENIEIPLADELADDASIDDVIDDALGEVTVDDLTVIDGIGPKYADGLQQIGVLSFSDLAQRDPDDLAAALKSLGLRIIGDRIRNQDWVGQAAEHAAEA